MSQSRWINHSQPGRLVQGTMMLYVTAAFDLISSIGLTGTQLGLLFFVLAVAKVAGGWGIANEKRLGYRVGAAAACASLVLSLLLLAARPILGLISVAIHLWVVSLLLHDTSRSYQRIWFR